MGNYGSKDEEYPVPHAITCRSTWAACPGVHETPLQVKACYEASRIPGAFPCSWLVEYRSEDGRATRECGAVATMDPVTGGFGCAAGHVHIPGQYLAEHHMAWAEDHREAIRLMRLGIQPLDIVSGTPCQL